MTRREPRPGNTATRRVSARAAGTALTAVSTAAVYLVTVGSASLWAVLQAGIVGAAGAGIAASVRAGQDASEVHRTPARAVFAQLSGLIAEVLLGSLRVARVAAGLAPIPRGVRVSVPISGTPDAVVISVAMLETLSPGTYLVAVDREGGRLEFHAFDAATARDLERRLTRLLDLGTTGPDVGRGGE